jgi:hypothetical protein
LTIDSGRRRREWESGRQPCVAPDVQTLLAGLGHAPEYDIIDRLGFDACALDDLFQHERAEDDRVEVLELAIATTDRCPHGLDDHDFAHVRCLLVAVVSPILGGAINRHGGQCQPHKNLPGEPTYLFVDVPLSG